MSKTIRIRLEVPEGISDEARESAQRVAHEAAVLALWERQQLTIREAAEELDLSYGDFLDLLAARGIPVVRGPFNASAVEEAERKLGGGHP
jgi:predicted HTH domain antitoxin